MARINIYDAIREFYLIEGLYAESLSLLIPFRHSHERWRKDFLSYRERYINQLARAIYDYTVLVSATEMRWADEKAEYHYEDWYSARWTDREEVYKKAIEYSDSFLLRASVRIFEINWGDFYGGPKWANIAHAGLLYKKIPDVLFIDHCVDLMHNGSIYFDKDTNIFYFKNQAVYKVMLDDKRDESFEFFLNIGKISFYMKKFLERLFNITGKNFIDDIAQCHDIDNVLNYKPIVWGDKVFDTTLSLTEDWEGFDEEEEE